MKTNRSNHRIHALTLLEVLVVIVVLFVLAAMLLPVVTPHHKGLRIACVYNLKEIGLAYRVWAGDNNDKYPMEVSVTNGGTMEWINTSDAWKTFQVMSNELNTPRILHCPADTRHFAATNFSSGFDARNISYFVGIDAGIKSPQMLLAGDDNFDLDGVPVKSGLLLLDSNSPVTWSAARHKFCGNIGLADGSVQEVNAVGLRSALQIAATNRLAIP